jgi:ATP-binding cassette subfamily C protein CydC
VVAFVVTLGVSLFAGSFHLSLGLILAAGLLVGGILVPMAARLASIRPGRAAVEQRAQLRVAVIDSVQGMPDLVSNGQEEHSIDAILHLSQELGRSQQNLAWAGGLSSGLMVLVSGLTLWLVLWTAIPLVNAGLFDGVALAVIALVTMASFEAVNPLGQAAQQLESSLQAARRLFALVDAEPEVRSPLQPCSPPPVYALHIRALSFRYQPDLPYALEDIDFDLPTGKRIALVGPSGAGKTTLANVLLRLWDYSEGEIRLGGCDLRQLDPQVVRQRFGVVSQRTYLFGGTLRDNLLLARPDANDEQMWQALRRAGLRSWVQSLPVQLDTWIGERGLQISAGERQRLAVARCILQDAPILLLDEPTANLDAHNEERVLASLNALMKDRSVLWITHRLVGMEAVDEIIVLDEGCVVQRGRHKDLLQQPGLYQRMWTLQNRIILDR